MKFHKLGALLALCALMALGFASSASARDLRSQTVDFPSDIGFQGTEAELIGMVMPQLMTQAGYDTQLATPRIAVDVQRAFLGSDAYLWSSTMVVTLDGQSFTITLPADLKALTNGRLALGILENGTLARAFQLDMVYDSASHEYNVTLTHPNGEPATRVALGRQDGQWLTTPQQLLALATVFYPSAAKGTFDPIIQTLYGIIDMLNSIKGIINMAICAVNELIGMFNNLNTCGWGETKPGGGAFVGLIICTIQDVTGFLSAVTTKCL